MWQAIGSFFLNIVTLGYNKWRAIQAELTMLREQVYQLKKENEMLRTMLKEYQQTTTNIYKTLKEIK